MSILKKLKSITIPTAQVVALLLILPLVTFYGGVIYDRKFQEAPTPTPQNEWSPDLRSYHGNCATYRLVNNPPINPPTNFPGYKESNLIEFNGEITAITNDKWTLRARQTHTSVYFDKDTIYTGKKDFHVGDCVHILYGVLTYGSNRVYQVSPQ